MFFGKVLFLVFVWVAKRLARCCFPEGNKAADVGLAYRKPPGCLYRGNSLYDPGNYALQSPPIEVEK